MRARLGTVSDWGVDMAEVFAPALTVRVRFFGVESVCTNPLPVTQKTKIKNLARGHSVDMAEI